MIGDHITDGRERGVSIAITHVLTIGITTILIAMLLMGGSTLLESETERSADTALETIGERLADEIENADRIASDGNTDVTLTVDHPRTVANTGYTITLLDSDEPSTSCDDPLIEADVDCLQLSTPSADVAVQVPVAEGVELSNGDSASGGKIEIGYDRGEGEVTIEEAS